VRLVSLVPCITHTLLALGGGDRLVGRTRYCPDCPAPVVGGIHDLDWDLLERLTPDLVLADPEENGPENLRRLQERFPVEAVTVRSVDDSLAFLRRAGTLAGHPDRAETLTDGFDGTPRPRCGSVVTLVWKEPWMAVGSDTYAAALLRHYGWETPVASAGYGPLSLDEVRRIRPDRLLLPSEPFEFTPSDARLLAGMLSPSTRVVCGDGRALFWYGAAMVETAGTLGRLLA
jgi:ABC-type hemin transport system substrate-binding protein